MGEVRREEEEETDLVTALPLIDFIFMSIYVKRYHLDGLRGRRKARVISN